MIYRKIAAMDISKRSIGLVFSDEDCQFVAYEYNFTSKKKDMELMKKLFEKHKPVMTYIGLPSTMKGLKASNTNFVQVFAHSYRKYIGKYEFLDERCTTNFGEMLNKMNTVPKNIDIVSARILLISGMQYFKIKNNILDD